MDTSKGFKVREKVVVHPPGAEYTTRGTIVETDFHPLGESYIKVEIDPMYYTPDIIETGQSQLWFSTHHAVRE